MIPIKIFHEFLEPIEDECCSFRNDAPYIYCFFDAEGNLVQSYLAADLMVISVEGKSVFDTIVAYLCSFIAFKLDPADYNCKYFIGFLNKLILGKDFDEPMTGMMISMLRKLGKM